MNIIHLFLKDFTKSGELYINHCPKVGTMDGLFINSLRGVLFQNNRALIMNTPLDIDDAHLVRKNPISDHMSMFQNVQISI